MFKITRRRVFIAIVILLVIGGIAWSRTKSSSDKKEDVKTVAVEQKNLIESVTSSGKTQALATVDLHFQTLGKLAWVGYQEGDHVASYSAIASLDVRQLKKDLEKTLRDYSKERNDFEEDRQVTYKGEVLTNIMSDTVKRILEKNQWDLEKAVLDVEMDTIAIQLSTLTTPIAGIVTHMDTPIAGVNVTSLNTFTVADLGSMIFSANIDETDIGKVMVGQSAEIRLDAFPDQIFKGTVTKIAYASEDSAGGTSVYPVEISLEAINNIRLGLNGDVAITISEKSTVISVPLEAVREDSDGNEYVILKNETGYTKKVVKTGIETENDVEIIEGLTENEQVVTQGFEFVPKELTQ